MAGKKVFKILVVDADPNLLDITVSTLKKGDHKVITAINGAECLKAVKKEKPDIILLDVMLPDANGKDICKIIKNDPEFSSVYIILISDLNTQPNDVSEGLEEGADCYLKRPVDSRELLAFIQVACRIIGAEEKAKKNEILLKACIDSPPDMIVLAIDNHYNYLEFNTYHKNVMRLTYGKDIKIGMNILDCITNKEDVVKSKINYDRAIAGESHITVEQYGELERQYYETRYSPIYNDKNEVIGATAFSLNVTKHKQLEESLKENEHLLRESQAIAGLGSYSWNLLKGTWSSSEIMDVIFGIDEHYVRTLEGWKNIIHPDWQELMIDYVTNQVLGERQKFDKEYLIIRQSDGKERWVHGLGELEYDKNNVAVKLIGTISDITDHKKAEELISESEKRFRSVFENSPLGKSMTGLDGSMRPNKSFCEMLGYSEDELKGKNWKEITYPDDIEKSNKVLDNLLNGKKQIILFEKRLIHNNGSIILAEVRSTLLRNEQGEPLHLISTFTDITERKHLEESLKKSEEKFRKAFTTSPDSININRLSDGMYVSINNGFTKTLGYTEDFIIGKTSVELNIWNNSSDRQQLVKGLKEKGMVENLVADFRSKDGSIISGMMSASLIDIDGVPHIISLTRDITERKLAEEQVRKSNELYNNLVSKIPVGVYILRSKPDGEFALEFVSSRMVKMLNTTAEAILSDARNVFKSIHPDERDEFIRLNAEGIQYGHSFDWKGRFLHNEKIKWMHVSSTPEPQENGDVLWHGIIVDITEQIQAELALNERSDELQNELEKKRKAEIELQKSHKKLEQSKLATLNLLEDIKQEMQQRKLAETELSKLNDELEQRVAERTTQLEAVNDELQAFAYSVSHDLRAPLRAIDGFSKFILEDYGPKLDEEGKRLLGQIRSNTQKMDQLIVDILALSRVTRNEHRISEVDMTKLVFSMLNEVASPELQSKINIVIDPLQNTNADPTYIKQVWVNLISNAIKFSSLRVKPEIKIGGYFENDFYVYYVKDNGVGFNPEYGHKLYGVFQRLHRADEFEGTGVGLAIVKRIVLRHGGKVWAEGIEGAGATFYFSLPVKPTPGS